MSDFAERLRCSGKRLTPQRELILRVQHAPAGLVAAQQGVPARADDELVAGIVAPRPQDGALHGCQDLALVGARAGQGEGGRVRLVGQGGRAAHMGDLGR